MIFVQPAFLPGNSNSRWKLSSVALGFPARCRRAGGMAAAGPGTQAPGQGGGSAAAGRRR